MTDKLPKPRGRPAKPTVTHIPDTPENIAKAIMRGPPAKEWDYLKKPERQRRPGEKCG